MGAKPGRAGKRGASPPPRQERFSGWPSGSEMVPQFNRQGARGHVMGSAESGNEVVERFFVQQVDRRQAQAPLVLVTLEKVVLTHR